MSDRKAFGPFKGIHLVLLALGATFVFGAIAAAEVEIAPSATQSVFVNNRSLAVTNYGTKTLAVSDSAVDPIVVYGRDPKYVVDIEVSNGGTQCESDQVYTPPAGKSLVITGVSGTLIGTGSSRQAGIALWASGFCNGTLLTDWENSLVSAAAGVASPINAQFNNGIVLPSGASLSVFSYFNKGFVFVHGYLVPAAAVPESATVQGRPVTAAMLAAKMGN